MTCGCANDRAPPLPTMQAEAQRADGEPAIGILLPRMLPTIFRQALPGLRKGNRRTAGHQKLCGSVACRREYRHIVAHRIEGKFGAKPQSPSNGASPSANPIEIGVRGPEKADRPWRLVAGTVSDTELRLATLPVDRATAARFDRLNREYWRDDNTTLIKRHHPPVNLVGGHRFRDAPNIDISPIAPNICKPACSTLVPVGETKRRSMPSQRGGQ